MNRLGYEDLYLSVIMVMRVDESQWCQWSPNHCVERLVTSVTSALHLLSSLRIPSEVGSVCVCLCVCMSVFVFFFCLPRSLSLCLILLCLERIFQRIMFVILPPDIRI